MTRELIDEYPGKEAMMEIGLETLWLRDNQRRRLLCTLERLRPGAEQRNPLLADLKNTEHRELESAAARKYAHDRRRLLRCSVQERQRMVKSITGKYLELALRRQIQY